MFAFLDIPPKAVADALTRYQHDIFCCIALEELIAWPLPTRGMAGYLAASDRDLHNWVIMAVGLSPQPQVAAKRLLQVRLFSVVPLTFFNGLCAQILDRLQALNNFNTLMCLTSGLLRVATFLSPKQRTVLDSYAALVSPSHNYRAWREHVAQVSLLLSLLFALTLFLLAPFDNNRVSHL